MVLNFQKCKRGIVILCLVCIPALFVLLYPRSIVTSAPTVSLSADNEVKEIKGYRNWTKVNSAPQLMLGRVATDCAIQLSPTGIDVNGTGNPHLNKYFTVYVNEVGRKAMLDQKNPQFPTGSVIVKEKLSARDSQTPELLTVMIKQKKGFNPASGDWEYMVADGTGSRVEGRGNLQNCQSCHVARPQTDYIFRTYLPDGVASKLR